MATKVGQAITAALGDNKVLKTEVDELTARAMSNKKLSAAEAKALKTVVKTAGKRFEKDAKTALETFVAENAPATQPPSGPADNYFANLRDAFDPPKHTPLDPRLETVFTPGDAAMLAEYHALDEVIAARKADPKSYPAGENPYRVEYAISNLNDQGVVNRLGQAARLGVKVQVLVDAGSIQPSKWYDTLVQDLTAQGFGFERSNLGLTGELKQKLLTGSHNPESAAHQNDEVLHTVHDQYLIDQYRYFYEACRDNRRVENLWNPKSALNVMFTSPLTQGPRAVDRILDLIDAESELICLSVFTLRNVADSDKTKLVDRLEAARERGCKVVVVTDHKQADGADAQGKPTGTDDKTDDLLAKAGIPTFDALNPAGPYNAMHLKACLFGLTDMKVATDAGNWTYSVMGNEKTGSWNAESILFVDSGELDRNHTGEQYLAEFMRLLRKYGPQNPGQPAAEQLIAELQKLPAWPQVKVDFSVLARTHLGQEVFITGNTPQLCCWGTDGPGLKLETDPNTCPNWRALEVEIPLGTALEYKIVKRDSDGGIEWEPGQNAVMVIDPSDFGHGSTDDLKVVDDFDGDR